jgi:hypothetical protein
MTTERRPRQPTPSPAAVPASELKRIPLPPLPHFRRPEMATRASPVASPAPGVAEMDAPARGATRGQEAAAEAPRPAGPVSHLEMSELLGPDHEGGIAPAIESVMPQRTGATGATILNDLVDQIERGLEKDLARVPIAVLTQGYRRVLACAGGPILGRAAGPGAARPAPPPAGGSERRTEE